jgi:SAM-dependent methyltransferase
MRNKKEDCFGVVKKGCDCEPVKVASVLTSEDVYEPWRRELYDLYVSTGQSSPDSSRRSTQTEPPPLFARQLLRKYVPKEKNLRILDLGAGTGKLMLFLQQHGYDNVYGVEYSEEQLHKARASGVKNILLGNVLSDNILDLGKFDMIFAIDLFEHFTREQLLPLLKRIKLMARPDCKIFIHVPNASGLFGSLARYADLTHELSFTPSSIRQLLNCAGYEGITIVEDVPIPHGIVSLARFAVWHVFSFPVRVLYAAESGKFPEALSQNMLVYAYVN